MLSPFDVPKPSAFSGVAAAPCSVAVAPSSDDWFGSSTLNWLDELNATAVKMPRLAFE